MLNIWISRYAVGADPALADIAVGHFTASRTSLFAHHVAFCHYRKRWTFVYPDTPHPKRTHMPIERPPSREILIRRKRIAASWLNSVRPIRIRS